VAAYGHLKWVTADVGDPALTNHIHAVMGLTRASDTWDQFMKMMDRAYTKKGDELELLEDE
jgi:hypothetical protein